VARRRQRLVHERPVVGAEHVRQQTAEPVAGLDVALEANLRADRHQLDERGRRLGAEALDRLVGVHGLGRVDADEAHRLDPPAGDLDLERVAVDERHDDAAVGRARVAGAAAPAGAEQRTGEQQREGANHEGLPVVFRSAPAGARRLQAPTGAG
jgi:hypothetical protein